MKLIPAIDLRDGTVVRLRQGDFAQTRSFDSKPMDLSARYVEAGADWLHVVDLDGARAGTPRHVELLAELTRLPVSIQWGGGVRRRADVDALLECGASRVVIGSVAARAPATMAQWLRELGAEQICLALDLRLTATGWQVAVDAWQAGSGVEIEALLAELLDSDLRHVLCTDIGRDGVAAGPNLDLYRSLVSRWPTLAWIASGGIRDQADVEALVDTGVAACVVGTALLDGSLPLSAIRR